ncbi:SpoIID/LytB domain-containing protein [Citricoccus sp. GCM10030269]|uniref:SpoIID/LytB domain-containing protein n=1 Tax=Citricoccus sp. GCM10030269 TaxID=3273388 RepID=UPI00360BFBC7
MPAIMSSSSSAARPGPLAAGPVLANRKRPWSRALALGLAAALAVIAAPVVSAGPAAATQSYCGREDFTDVPPGSGFYGDVSWMACTGITVGYADGTFQRGRDITRGEIAAFLYRQVDPEYSPDRQRDFSDVNPGGAYFDAISWMVDEGITVGRTDGTFGPQEPVSRGELTAFLYRMGADEFTPPAASPFSDLTPASANYRSITWASARGITVGYADETFRQSRSINRGEASAFLHRADGDVLGDRVPTSFTAWGSGWGHGVGMSQYGARALAVGGSSAEQILGYYYSPAKVAHQGTFADADIRVQLHTTASTTLDGSRRVRVDGVGTTSGAVKLAVQGNQVDVTLNGSTQTVSRAVVEWEGTRHWKGNGGSTITVPDANGGRSPLELRHGRLVVSVRDGKLNITNTVRMNDEYLYGVAEMPSAWPSEALKSQVIASRTYAIRNMVGGVKANCDCHVTDEVSSQKFTGWAKENETVEGTNWGLRWKAAVDATISRQTNGAPGSADSLWYNHSIIDATYFSSSGGHTRWAEDVWSNPVAYLTGRPDPYSLAEAARNPNASWSKTVSQAEMAKAFGLKDVVALEVTPDRDRTAKYITATARDGSTSRLTGNQFRSKVATLSAWIFAVDRN